MTLPTPVVPDGFADADLRADDARAQLIDLDLWGFPGAFDPAEVLTWSWPLDLDRARALALAARLRVIVDLATADDGGAVNLWQADQRSAALRHVDHAARRAMCAATLVVPV